MTFTVIPILIDTFSEVTKGQLQVIIGWLVGWFYAVSILFGSFNAEQGLVDSEITGRGENIKTIALLRSARILRGVLET